MKERQRGRNKQNWPCGQGINQQPVGDVGVLSRFIKNHLPNADCSIAKMRGNDFCSPRLILVRALALPPSSGSSAHTRRDITALSQQHNIIHTSSHQPLLVCVWRHINHWLYELNTNTLDNNIRSRSYRPSWITYLLSMIILILYTRTFLLSAIHLSFLLLIRSSLWYKTLAVFFGGAQLSLNISLVRGALNFFPSLHHSSCHLKYKTTPPLAPLFLSLWQDDKVDRTNDLISFELMTSYCRPHLVALRSQNKNYINF